MVAAGRFGPVLTGEPLQVIVAMVAGYTLLELLA
jgi:hypothetical protein